MLQTRYHAPVPPRRRDLLSFGLRYALPAATGLGLERAWHAWSGGAGIGRAAAVGAAFTLGGAVLFVLLRPLGLQTPSEVAATPALAAEVRRRRPWLLGALLAAVAYVGWLFWTASRSAG